MSGVQVPTVIVEHAPHNAMQDSEEIARFHDRCSDLMRELLDCLAATPDRARPFPEIEDAIGWPRRRIASVLGGVARLPQTEFGGPNSDAGARRGFCGDCGSSLFWDPPRRETISIAAGTLDDASELRVAGHWFVSQAGGYYELPEDGTPRHAGSAEHESPLT